MIKDKHSIPALKRVSEVHGLDVKEIERVHDSPFKFIKETIQEIPFKEMTLDEFKVAKKTFSIPGLGKIYPSESIFISVNKNKNKINNIKKEVL